MKFFGSNRSINDIGIYLLPPHQFTALATMVKDNVDHVSEMQLLEPCSSHKKHLIDCT